MLWRMEGGGATIPIKKNQEGLLTDPDRRWVSGRTPWTKRPSAEIGTLEGDVLSHETLLDVIISLIILWGCPLGNWK